MIRGLRMPLGLAQHCRSPQHRYKHTVDDAPLLCHLLSAQPSVILGSYDFETSSLFSSCFLKEHILN
jgi:hypothetical protein